MDSPPTPQRRRRRTVWIAAVVVGLALVGATLIDLPRGGPPTTVRMWVTSSDGARTLSPAPALALRKDARRATISIVPGEHHQTMLGFGASMTESSASLIQRLPVGERTRLLDDLFSPVDGIGLNYVRVPVGSSDFVASTPFTAFDRTRDEQAVLPLLRAAKRRNPHLRVMASPWSAPARMKDSERLDGGSLRADAIDSYADYLVAFLQAYAQAGVRVDDLTVQNEPLLATSYPSMTMSADQQAQLIRVLDAKLTATGLSTQIFAFDHNWDHPEYPLEVFAKTTGVRRLAGAAFHCYDGEPEAQAQIRAAGKRVLETECSGTDTGATTFAETLHWQTERLIIRGPRSGAETALTWNLALDPQGGPEHGTCATRCNGVVEINGGGYRRNAEYYVLAHASRFLRPGAVRIGSRSASTERLQHVAFENKDRSRVLIVQNIGPRESFNVADGDRSFSSTIPDGAIATYVWR